MDSTRPSLEARPQTEREGSVLCAACQHVITSRRSQIEMNGAHEHTFRNPAGYSFHVLCFGEAPGCIRGGDPTDNASWFAGFAWSFALCGRCHQHLGWHYVGPSTSFFGLIATRLLRQAQV